MIRQGIPEGLVRADGNRLQFEDAMAPSINYSLVHIGSETVSFDMHRLVQLSVRTWQEIHLELARWQEKARATMAEMSPNGEYESWTECKRLLPHAQEGVKPSFNTDEDDSMNDATILSTCGWYLHRQGAYFDAEAMRRRAFVRRAKMIGPEHPYTLASANQLGLVLDSQEKYEEAEAMYRQGLEVREKLLGPENLDTINSVNNIGHLLRKQGKFAMAEAMYRRASCYGQQCQ